MEVAVPDKLRPWVEERARAEHQGSAEAYVSALIERDREDLEALADLQRAVTEGLESGVDERPVEALRLALRHET